MFAVGLRLMAFLAPGIVLVGLSWLPHQAIVASLRGLNPGLADRYSPSVAERFTPRLQTVGIVLLAVGLAAWFWRAELRRLGTALVHDSREDFRRLGIWQSVRSQAVPLTGLLVLTVLALWLRLGWLQQPMQYDESYTYLAYSSQPWYVSVSMYDFPNNHVLHSLGVHFACRWFGDDPWALRLLALLAGVLLVPATYLAGRLQYDQPTALLASALVCASAVLVEYSTNARGYALQALLVLLLVALSCLLLQRRSVLSWLVWSLVAALGFWTVPTMLYAVAGVVVWLVLCCRTQPTTQSEYGGTFYYHLAGACLAAGLLTILLYSPILLNAGPAALVGNRFVTPLTPDSWLHGLPGNLAATGQLWLRGMPGVLAAMILLGGVIGLLAHQRAARQTVPLLPVLFVVSLAIMAIQRVLPFERIWLFALPLFLLTAAAGIATLIRALRSTTARAAIAGLVGVMVLVAAERTSRSAVSQSLETGSFPSGPEVAAFLKESLAASDRVIVECPANAPVMYYLARQGQALDCFADTVALRNGDGVRLWVVVPAGQSIAGLMQRHELGGRGISFLAARFATAEVHLITPRDPHSPADDGSVQEFAAAPLR